VNKRKKGIWAENLACEFLVNKGLTIEYRNFRYKRAEVDIIAWEDKVLVFVEVKYRRTDYFGAPETAVDEAKQALILDAAAAYAEKIDHDWALRFDIVAITGGPGDLKIEHIRDAFFPQF
jgi:putative endonuclease